MLFQSALPSPWLRNVVRMYWNAAYNHQDLNAMPAHFPAAVNQSLIFPLTGPFTIQRRNGDPAWTPPSFLVGHLTEDYFINNVNTKAFGVELHHSSIFRLWGLAAQEFCDSYTCLTDLFNREGEFLTEQINLAVTFPERVQIIETFLTKALMNSRKNTTLADHSIKLVKQTRGAISIEQMARHCHLSYRQYNRKFTEQIGIRPKLYASLFRFNCLFQDLSRFEKTNWQKMLYRYHYFDQSHFIKDFKRFTGTSPNRYFKNRFHLFSQHFILQQEE